MNLRFQKTVKNKKERTAERGNALWFILLAIVLLSALTLVVSRSGSSIDQSADVEHLRIKATQLMRYSASIEAAIDRLMTVQGCSENEISFINTTVLSYTNAKSPSDKSCNIFDKAGAGLEWRSFGTDNLTNAGGDVAFMRGIRIEGLGSDTAAELVMAVMVSQALCERVNIERGLSTTAADITLGITNWNNFYIGTFVTDYQIEAAGDAPGLVGAQTGCMIDASGDYVFYQAVLVR